LIPFPGANIFEHFQDGIPVGKGFLRSRTNPLPIRTFLKLVAKIFTMPTEQEATDSGLEHGRGTSDRPSHARRPVSPVKKVMVLGFSADN
jgi:hypothetical protein